ncbi:hypothetical protein CBR_g1170 [Chara braunii]|uniref:Uncharacterized protein n=1 Tax=Chara braunii TaxID=69332 RepID=A0A388KDC9_CHABU|nr:hypothetical protein CBR_g1170 [Chara braunii]|eukprot:GBG68049.1 hypothetical protein CBR_g1170 [Chara braunii]
MGTNAGPEIANLTLYWDEAQYVDNLQRVDPSAASRYAFTYRFIDDVLTFDCLPPSSAHYGLEWKETTAADGSCTFLGAKLQTRADGSLRLSVFDKTVAWDFPVIRYPSATSNIPSHQPAGVFTGQLTRFEQICDNWRDFKTAATMLVRRLLSRGHAPSTLARIDGLEKEEERGGNTVGLMFGGQSSCHTVKPTFLTGIDGLEEEEERGGNTVGLMFGGQSSCQTVKPTFLTGIDGLEEEEERGRNTVGLDFLSAFHGSVFEKYHVLPLQLATMSASSVIGESPVKLQMCHRGEDLPLALGFALIEFAISHCPRLFVRMFSRSGMDVTHECDETVAQKLFELCKAVADINCFHSFLALAQLIDFDLVGIDDKHLPLRMLLTSLPGDGWFAEVRDRESGSLFATATRGNKKGQTLLEIVGLSIVEERYKPHGDVPTMLGRVTACKHERIDRQSVDENADVILYIEDCCSEGLVSSTIGSEEMRSLYHLREASFIKRVGHSIFYSGNSEFERLLPVAASLGYLHLSLYCQYVFSGFDPIDSIALQASHINAGRGVAERSPTS